MANAYNPPRKSDGRFGPGNPGRWPGAARGGALRPDPDRAGRAAVTVIYGEFTVVSALPSLSGAPAITRRFAAP